METAKLEETVEKILKEKPEIIITALRRNPEILKQVVSDSLPHNVSTKDDIKILHEEMKLMIEMINKRFEDMNKRFEDMKNYTDKRFEDMNKRLEFIQKLILFLLGLNLVNTSSLIVILLKIFNAI
jgi:hypothetical protein